MGNRKWWWYILFYAIDFILTNASIIYICMHNMHGTPMKHILSHHDFINAIEFVWIDPEKYNAGEFDVQSEIPAPRRKIKLDLSSS